MGQPNNDIEIIQKFLDTLAEALIEGKVDVVAKKSEVSIGEDDTLNYTLQFLGQDIVAYPDEILIGVTNIHLDPWAQEAAQRLWKACKEREIFQELDASHAARKRLEAQKRSERENQYHFLAATLRAKQ